MSLLRVAFVRYGGRPHFDKKQTFKGNHLQNNAESQISAMAYLDLLLRSVTEPGLLRVFVRFLLDADKFDGQRIVDVLVERISSVDTRVS